MEKIEEVDHLKKQLVDTEVARAQLALQSALIAQQSVHGHIAAKYAIQPGDTYDPQTLEIKRAPRAEPENVATVTPLKGGKKAK